MAMSLLGLLRSILVFLMLVAAGWGVGDTIVSFIEKKVGSISKLARIFISIALGLGVIGQFVFIAGLIGDFYQLQYVWPFMLLLLLFSVARFNKNFPALDSKFNFGKMEVAVIALTLFSLLIWLWGLLSFTTGSDVITNHYQFVKFCISLKHFGHNVTVPFGMDNFSTYSPVLIHMLYLIGTLLSDVRAANLIHWLSHVLLIMGIYVFSRDFFSRSAAFIAVAIYLGFTVLFNFSLDVNNYVALAVFMIFSMYYIFLYKNTNSSKYLVIAGILAGLMLSTKYYGIALMAPLCVPILLNNSQKMHLRIKGVFIFSLVAFIVYLPWIIYNLKEFGVPIYPSMANIDYINYWTAVRREEVLDPFVVFTDHGYFWPKLFYYLSMFIPFEPDYRMFGLTPIFLIGLPCSFYYLFKSKGDKWRNINILFIMSLLAWFLVEAASWPYAFYKTGIFAGSIYAISLAALVTCLIKKSKQLMLTAIIFVAILSTYFGYKHIKDFLHMPLVMDQEYYWSPLVKYINKNLEKNVSIANDDLYSSYYLRPDIKSFPGYNLCIPYNWSQEERLIRSLGVQYYVFNAKEREGSLSYAKRMFEILNNLHAFDRAGSFDEQTRLYIQRTDEQELFLNKNGNIIKEFPGGIKIYKMHLKDK